MGWRLLPAGNWDGGDVADRRRVSARRNWERQSRDGDSLPQWARGPGLDKQFERRGENRRKSRDWNLFPQWRGLETGQLAGWEPCSGHAAAKCPGKPCRESIRCEPSQPELGGITDNVNVTGYLIERQDPG